AGMNFNDLMLAYSRQLGIGVNRDKGRLWALLSHLMLETRRGISRVLVLDHAEVLDALCFDELLRFSQLDAPRPVPIVLMASPAFSELLTSPALDFVNAAITGRLAVDRLAPEEVGAFIQYQLNGQSEGGASPFSTELIALIATAADGNPAVINALAREIVLSTKPRRLTAEEMREPEVEPAPRNEEAPPEAVAAEPAPGPAPVAGAEQRQRRARRRGMDLQLAGYVALVVLIGAGLLYALWPGGSPPVATPSVAVIAPMPENGAMVAVPAAAPETATAATAESAPSDTAPPAATASVEATPAAPEAEASPPPAATAASSDNAPTAAAPEPTATATAVSLPDAAPSDAVATAAPAAEPPATAAAAPAPAVEPAAPSAPAAEPEATPATPSATMAAIEPQAAPPPPRPDIPSAEVAVMLQRGDQLFAAGDIVSARQFYERAATSGNAAALCGVGRSFDPLVLRNSGVLGMVGDAATAIAWYRKAADAGSAEAEMRLKRLAAAARPDSKRR
ncbi:MAG TPA: hypothetical protein VLX85_01975, partial [Stellaceae bacterium]|nr:hypothetical protein [Stellaceae bacterium]